MSGGRHELHTKSTPAPAFTVEAIRDQITAAWADLGYQAEQMGTAPPLRTSILTLVVVAHGNREVARAREVLSNLVHAVPSRVILVAVRHDVEALAASVSAHCALRGTDQVSCYEIVEIETPPHSLRAIPSVLTQLEISDLITFIWWVGPIDFSVEEYGRISAVGERVIIDSSRFRDSLRAMRLQARFLRSHPELAGSDLTWNRMLPWRELIAQSFDIPAAQAMLPNLQRVDMTFDPGSRADAVLCAGWLTSRLGFEPEEATESAGVTVFSACNAGRNVVRFNLSEVASSGIGLRSVRLVANTGRHTTRVTVRLIEGERAAVTIEMTGGPRQQRIVHFNDMSDVEALAQELHQFNRDPIYEKALNHAARFAAMLEPEEVKV